MSRSGSPHQCRWLGEEKAHFQAATKVRYGGGGGADKKGAHTRNSLTCFARCGISPNKSYPDFLFLLKHYFSITLSYPLCILILQFIIFQSGDRWSVQHFMKFLYRRWEGMGGSWIFEHLSADFPGKEGNFPPVHPAVPLSVTVCFSFLDGLLFPFNDKAFPPLLFFRSRRLYRPLCCSATKVNTMKGKGGCSFLK